LIGIALKRSGSTAVPFSTSMQPSVTARSMNASADSCGKLEALSTSKQNSVTTSRSALTCGASAASMSRPALSLAQRVKLGTMPACRRLANSWVATIAVSSKTSSVSLSESLEKKAPRPGMA
jgi:hypothetical protein